MSFLDPRYPEFGHHLFLPNRFAPCIMIHFSYLSFPFFYLKKHCCNSITCYEYKIALNINIKATNVLKPSLSWMIDSESWQFSTKISLSSIRQVFLLHTGINWDSLWFDQDLKWINWVSESSLVTALSLYNLKVFSHTSVTRRHPPSWEVLMSEYNLVLAPRMDTAVPQRELSDVPWQ